MTSVQAASVSESLVTHTTRDSRERRLMSASADEGKSAARETSVSMQGPACRRGVGEGGCVVVVVGLWAETCIAAKAAAVSVPDVGC